MRQERQGKRGGIVLSLVLSLVAALFALAGCKSGTLVGQEQSCEVSGGLLAEERAACTGSVDAVRGEPQLVIVDTDGELDGTYRLEATLSVGKGETKPTSRRPTVTGSAASSRRASRSGSPPTSRSTMKTRR